MSFGKKAANLSSQFDATPDRRFEFYESSQLFIGVRNKTPFVAVCISNEEGAPGAIHR